MSGAHSRSSGNPPASPREVASEPHARGVANHADRPFMILIAGPYRTDTNDDPLLIAANVRAMTDMALRLFRAGHLPVLGEWFALPLIEHAGSKHIGDGIFDEIFHPISRTLVSKCDACLRIGGASKGADEMVERSRALGKQVFFSLAEIPGCA